MNQGYEAFCMADPSFYDAMHSVTTAGESFPTASRSLPAGWTRREQDDWIVFDPGDADLPDQGWKIHVSACLDNATRILDAVWEYCVPRGIEFKFLRSPNALVARISKYAPRDFSGKLVTIYPENDRACHRILAELGELVDGEPSPYILSDLRWGKGPLYVRYGAFSMRQCVDESGRIVPAIADDTGALVPDPRGPVFTVPPWVTLPDFLEPHVAARNAVKVDGLPYAIERVLHFSNGGGIYLARDRRSGEQVVLKEARPHSGLDAWGHDAVRRLEREHDTLRRLAGIPGVPRVHDLFWLGEHRFCVMEYVEGEPLSKAIVHRYPLIDATTGADDFARFTAWALDVQGQVEATVDAVHERGIVYGDLHLFNLMVRPDGRVVLLDFEVASTVDEAVPPGLGNQGFSPPAGTTGVAVDRYALACLRLALFLPLTTLLWLHRPKARHLARIIAEHFPVPPEFLAAAVDLIDPTSPPPSPPPSLPGAAAPADDAPADDVPRHLLASAVTRSRSKTGPEPDLRVELFEPTRRHWPELRDNLAGAIVASATPDRDDRLFPGDVEQFAVGGLGLAYGAAGVLHALSVTGAGRYPQLEEWLLHRVENPPAGTRPGLFDGLHGAAFALDHLGYRQAALDAVDRCLSGQWEALGLDLAGGLPGIGLTLLHLAQPDDAHESEAGLSLAGLRAADLVAEQLRDEDPDAGEPAPISGGNQPNAGLMRGSAGPALLLIRAFDATRQTSYLDRAAVALRQDLRRCVVRDNGAMEVNEGWRTMPYLDVGSVGIGLVLDEYLARRHDDQFAEASRQIQLAAQAEMYILPGLFPGRAGILLYLAGRSPSPLDDPLVARQVRNLSWHALPYGGGLAFPGTALLRLSMDVATGTAGVLLALAAALHHEPVHLPLLGPYRRPGTPDMAPPDVLASTVPTPAPTGPGA